MWRQAAYWASSCPVRYLRAGDTRTLTLASQCVLQFVSCSPIPNKLQQRSSRVLCFTANGYVTDVDWDLSDTHAPQGYSQA
jgi:hypothetical protein